MNKYSIRPANIEDIPFLWDMLYESIYTPEGQEPPSRDILQLPFIAKYLENWGQKGDIAFIAVNENGDSIGSITARTLTFENKGFGYVNDETPELGMALLPQYRGQGIGTVLMKTLLIHAKDTGVPSMSLSVDPANPAVKLYKKFGFQEVGMEGTSITMFLDLNLLVLSK